MKEKEITKSTVIRREFIEQDGIEYRYELEMRERQRGSFNLPLYSISVEMILDDGSTTYAETNEIFSDVGKAIAFFDRMIKNLATPIDLGYVVEDEIKG